MLDVRMPETLTVQDVRRGNLARIMRAVQQHTGISQADVVRRTGLAVGGVSTLVGELVAATLLEVTTAMAPSGRGRPRRFLRLADSGPDLVGVAVTRSGVQVRVATLAGRELHRVSRPFGDGLPSPGQAGQAIAELVVEALRGTEPGTRVPRVVISIPGVQDGDLIGSTELGWLRIPQAPLTAPLAELGFPEVRVGNDGSLATLAEYRQGVGRDFDNVVLLMVGRGFGGSAVVDGRLLKGHGAPPGFGHVPVVRGGLECICGLRGCVELYASVGAMARALGEGDRLDGEPTSVYVDELVRRAARGDGAVVAVLDAAREHIAELGGLLAAVLAPDVVLLGGHGAPLAPWLVVDTVGNAGTPMRRGRFGGEGPILGALVAAQDAVIEDPLATVGTGRRPAASALHAADG